MYSHREAGRVKDLTAPR